jgi:putative sigma-54 modulation protein
MSRKSRAAEFQQVGYNISITGRNVMVTDAMKDYAMEKISKIERFSTRIIDVMVTMDIQKLEHRVDIVLKVNNLKIKCQAVSENMYASIDKATDKLQAQLRRYNKRIHDHQAKGLVPVDMNVTVVRATPEEEVLEVNDEIEDESRRRLLDKYHPHKIVSRETRQLKFLTDGEAIMKMELSGDVFLIYRGEEDRKLKVMYRRNDDDYGVIQAEA